MNFRIIILFLAMLGCEAFGEIKSWETVGEMPFPVYGGEAVSCDSVIYIFGGYSESLNTPTDLIQAYYPGRNEWKNIGNMKETRVGFVALKYNDEIIIYGGLAEGDTISPVIERVKILPDTIIFTNDTTIKENRIYSSGIIKDNSLIIIGGNYELANNNIIDSSYIFIYNLDTKSTPEKINSTFSSSSSLPVQQMCAIYDNVIYIFGGLYLGISSWIYEFNTYDLLFAKNLRDLLEPRAGGKAIQGDSGFIFLIGGYNETTNSLKSTEIFNVWEQNLQSGPSLNEPRKEFMAIRYQQTIYVFGGKGMDEKTVSTVERLDFGPVTSSTEEKTRLKKFDLSNCYPNPFNPSTKIAFSIPDGRNIKLTVYSAIGEEVRTIISGYYTPGVYHVTWDGKDDHGNNMSSGVYFFRLSDGINYFTKKALLLK